MDDVELPSWRLRIHAEDVPAKHSGGIEGFVLGLTKGFLQCNGSFGLQLLVRASDFSVWRARLPDTARLEIISYGGGSEKAAAARSRLKRFLRQSSIVWQIRIAIRRWRQRAISADQLPVVDYFPFHRGRIFGDLTAVTVHDLRALDAEYGDRASAENVAHNIVNADLVFTSWAHPERALLQAFPQTASKLHRVPFPIMHDAAAADAVPPSGVLEGDRFLLFPAGVVPHKNHRLLLEYLGRYRPCDFRIICTGNADTSEGRSIRSAVTELDLESSFQFLGFVDEGQLSWLYKHAWGLVMPSLYEAASGPIMEGMSYGLPILCSDIEVFRNQMHESGGSCSWFDPNDVESLHRAIQHLREHRDQLVAASQEGAKWYASLSWTRAASTYIRAMENKFFA